MAVKKNHKAKCEQYRTRRMREKNKAKKLTKHLRTNQNDKDAQKAYKLVA